MEQDRKNRSFEEVSHLLEQLPAKLDSLLDRCAAEKPPFTPDYSTFESETLYLLEPFAEYADAAFHEGNIGHSSYVYRSVMWVFSKRKHHLLQELQRAGDDLRKGKPEAIAPFTRFKLLSYFFDPKAPYPHFLHALFDLEYQLEIEDDPRKREALITQISELSGDTSTGLCCQALAAMNSGDLALALQLCEQAIDRFRENTFAYGLKSTILRNLAGQAIEEGLKREPRDLSLKLARDIESQFALLRRKCAEGRLDPDELIERLDHLVREELQRAGIDLHPYDDKVKQALVHSDQVHQEILAFLRTGEYLLANLPESLDHAPSAVEFCKGLETELGLCFFAPFRAQCLSSFPKTPSVSKESASLLNFVYKNKKLTLGNMAWSLQVVGSKKRVQGDPLLAQLRDFIDSLPQPTGIMGSGGLREQLTMEAVNHNRNGAAHDRLVSLESARKTRDWCYSLINLALASVY